MLKRMILAAILILFSFNLVSAKDLRAIRLKKFLDRYPGNPLRSHIHEILYCADKFGLDYRLYVALSGAESGYGRHLPKFSQNFTGIGNGKIRFPSIFANIYYTHELIATKKWYHRYRATRRLKDLVYVYKHVPPFKPYLRTLRYILDCIASVNIAEEKSHEEAERKLVLQKNKINQKKLLMAWNEIRYDHYPRRRTISCNPLKD